MIAAFRAIFCIAFAGLISLVFTNTLSEAIFGPTGSTGQTLIIWAISFAFSILCLYASGDTMRTREMAGTITAGLMAAFSAIYFLESRAPENLRHLGASNLAAADWKMLAAGAERDRHMFLSALLQAILFLAVVVTSKVLRRWRSKKS